MGKKEFELGIEEDGNPYVEITEYLEEEGKNKGKLKTNKVLRKVTACRIAIILSASALIGGLTAVAWNGPKLDAVRDKQDNLVNQIKSSDTYYEYITQKQNTYRDALEQGVLDEEEYVDKLSSLLDDNTILSGNFEGCDSQYNEEAKLLKEEMNSCENNLNSSFGIVGLGFFGVIGGLLAYPSSRQIAEAQKQKEEEISM